MASNSYSLYKQRNNAVKSYDGNLGELQRILDNLTNTMGDEIWGVNTALDNLKSDLDRGIRHNARFASYANAVVAEKERAVTSDPHLRIAVQELQEEMGGINTLRSQAVAERDYYYQKHKNKQ